MRPLLFLLPVIPAVFAGLNDSEQSLLWGTYRPNLYFGLRPRLPQSLLSGLMWFGTQDYIQYQKIRHACDQGDGLGSYIWSEHDMREGGVQVVKDDVNNAELRMEWLKVPGGEHGGSWAARISGKPIDHDKPLRLSLIYYFGLEGLGELEWTSKTHRDGLTEPVNLSGSSADLGEFQITIADNPNNKFITDGDYADDFRAMHGKSYYLGIPVPSGEAWKAKDILLRHIVDRGRIIVEPYKDTGLNPDPAYVLALGNEIHDQSNFYAVQKSLDGAFSFDIIFDSGSVPQKIDASIISAGVSAFTDRFNSKFQDVFPVPHESPRDLLAFSKAITSNLFGGIGYFYGTSIIDQAFKHEWDLDEDDDEDEQQANHKSDPKLQPARELLTATPSRSFFPRGFYWDEGFHLLHIGAWDNDLSLEILKDWIDLIDENGWVGREQILGEEARSKVPPEFQAQYPSNANPPTLTMAVTAFIERLRRQGPTAEELGMPEIGKQKPFSADSSPTNTAANKHLIDQEAAISYLRSIYPPLRRHYDWFRSTQRGWIKRYGRKARSRTEAYRWRGRSQDHILTSGMDDYPRGPPHAGELHLDLISWMAFFSRTMKQIAEFVGEKEDEAYFSGIEKAILDNIEDLHWNEEEQLYCDLGISADDESVFVCNRGYLSLFPFLLGLLPSSSPHLGPILDLVRDPQHLWSPYGLRSLSASHPLFGQGENYWRGPIWIQMNYLALSSLYKVYAAEPGPYRERATQIYTELRQNVIDNVYKEYERTGYVWEQYDAVNGSGRRSHPFTGWTSLVTLIISEKY